MHSVRQEDNAVSHVIIRVILFFFFSRLCFLFLTLIFIFEIQILYMFVVQLMVQQFWLSF